ncbi:helix-turn-helix domain-containing protein [Patescibacteria group bacterium]|nr:helix-turn-helix domain-containing protein [Patescibacteria group bacterium]
MEKEKLNNRNLPPKEGYIIISNSFFKEWTGVLGDGPILLYLELLTYCHKDKDTAWPTLKTLSRGLHKSTKSITRHHRKLVKAGLIKKVVKSKVASGNYKRNVYQLVHPDGTKKSLNRGTFVPYIGDKNVPNLGTKCPLNNTNKQNQYNNRNCGKKLPAVAVIDKLKEEGEEKMKAIREQLLSLDFKESFIEKLLKDYPAEKIKEKLELLMEKKNIINPTGWLMAALKYDYQNPERYEREEDEKREKISPKKINRKKEASSRLKALEMIKKTKKMLANLKKKEEMCNGTKRINCQS